MNRLKPPALLPWTQFEQEYILPSDDEIARHMAASGASREEACTALARALNAEKERFVNSRYAVTRRHIPSKGGHPALVHLSIRRIDGEPMGPERYRDFMRIRDELVGFENEAVEVYPRRSQEVDTVNQYHLWALASEGFEFPFGFRHGREILRHPPEGCKQRPFDPDDYEMVSGRESATIATIARPQG